MVVNAAQLATYSQAKQFLLTTCKCVKIKGKFGMQMPSLKIGNYVCIYLRTSLKTA